MSFHPSLHRLVLTLCLAGLSAAPLAARAQSGEGAGAADNANVEQARKHFNQGLKLYKDGDFDPALIQFERAYAVKPNFKVLYNIAQCYFELHQYVEARDTLSRYLKDGAGAIDAERQSAVESDLSELQRRIAHVAVNVNVAGATVYVDGKKAGITPLTSPIDVNEGQRTISVETTDRGSKQRIVRVAGGEEQTVNLEFVAPAAASSGIVSKPRTDSSPRQASGGLGAGFWVTGSAALVLGAGAGVTGYFALKARDDHDQDLARFGVTQSELDDSRKQAKTFALTTDILTGAAIVCAGVATVLLFTHDSGAQQVGLGVGPGNVALRGNF
jgi:hypothetical protein